MTELNSQARALLNSARSLGEPSAGDLERALAAFEIERSEANTGVSPDAGSPSQLRSRFAWPLRSAKPSRLTRVLLAAFVLSASLGAAASWSRFFQKAEQIASEARPTINAPESAADSPPARRDNPRATPAPNPSPAEADFPEVSPSHEAKLNPKPDLPAPALLAPFAHVGSRGGAAAVLPIAPQSASASPGSLDAELELIVAARDALRGEDYQRATALATQHQVRFPGGALAQEASAIVALAECRAGRAPAQARRHLARWPQSFFNERIKKTCGSLISSVQISPRPSTDFAKETPEGSF